MPWPSSAGGLGAGLGVRAGSLPRATSANPSQETRPRCRGSRGGDRRQLGPVTREHAGPGDPGSRAPLLPEQAAVSAALQPPPRARARGVYDFFSFFKGLIKENAIMMFLT